MPRLHIPTLAAAAAFAVCGLVNAQSSGSGDASSLAAGASLLPPEARRYLAEPPPESKQFDFLIGNWLADVARYKPDGSMALKYKATWTAMRLNGGRMIMDDYKALGPGGQPVTSFVTLRTYSEATNRWELAGLQAQQPTGLTDWHGAFKDGEMHLQSTAVTPTGATVMTKVRYYNIEKDSFSWQTTTSLDKGATWVKTSDAKAMRIAGQ